MRMLRLSLSVFLFVFCFCAPTAQASDNDLPNYLVFGGGWQEIRDNTPYKNGGDFRIEHRWGLSLLSAMTDSLKPVDDTFQLHPFVGLETTTNYQIYAFGGLVFDFLLGRSVVISPSFGAGFYSQGEGKRLGCPLEFRSTLEAGVRLENEWRVTGYVGHTSNASLGDHNPGVEHAGVYLHVPLSP